MSDMKAYGDGSDFFVYLDHAQLPHLKLPLSAALKHQNTISDLEKTLTLSIGKNPDIVCSPSDVDFNGVKNFNVVITPSHYDMLRRIDERAAGLGRNNYVAIDKSGRRVYVMVVLDSSSLV